MDSEVSGGLTVDSEEDEHVREQVKPQSSKKKPIELEREKKNFEKIMLKEPHRITVKSANFTKSDKIVR